MIRWTGLAPWEFEFGLGFTSLIRHSLGGCAYMAHDASVIDYPQPLPPALPREGVVTTTSEGVFTTTDIRNMYPKQVITSTTAAVYAPLQRRCLRRGVERGNMYSARWVRTKKGAKFNDPNHRVHRATPQPPEWKHSVFFNAIELY